MIRFDKVTKHLSGRNVLDDISFEVTKGEIFVIVGPSGAGKSVTLKHMVRLMTPTSGSVWVGDVSVGEARGRVLDRVRERFGYLFQSGALLGWMTVRDNIALPLLERTRLKSWEVYAQADEALRMVGLEGDGNKFPNEISGGMQKRASLARAIVRRPEIVLYDEPTSGLDPVTAQSIDQLIVNLNRELGITSVVVTHDMRGALGVASRIAMLTQGRFVEVNPPAGFVASQQPEVRAFLEAHNIGERDLQRLKGGMV